MRALIKDGAVAQFPYSVAQMKRDNPDVGFPPDFAPPFEAPNGTLVNVSQAEMPEAGIGQKIVGETTPTLVDSEWVLGWSVEDMTPDELSADVAARRRAVDAERDRRTNAGFTYLGHLFQSDQKSRENITGATTSAVAYLVSGGGVTEADWTGSGSPFVWLAEDNTAVPLTAPEMIAFGNAAMAHVAALIYKGRAIKALDPIPADFTDDSYWV
ncbi:MAG: DUF4376 domain-containing protein [Sulfitobacter sp.]|nr:DUF4376 domain-containing protein [Sulfitobacter sp.]